MIQIGVILGDTQKRDLDKYTQESNTDKHVISGEKKKRVQYKNIP